MEKLALRSDSENWKGSERSMDAARNCATGWVFCDGKEQCLIKGIIILPLPLA